MHVPPGQAPQHHCRDTRLTDGNRWSFKLSPAQTTLPAHSPTAGGGRTSRGILIEPRRPASPGAESLVTRARAWKEGAAGCLNNGAGAAAVLPLVLAAVASMAAAGAWVLLRGSLRG